MTVIAADVPAPVASLVRRVRTGAFTLAAGLAAFLLVGNIAIWAASAVMELTTPQERPAIDGIGHLRVVDERVWRGAAPDDSDYRALAAAGVVTIVDLRAEGNVATALLANLGLSLVRIPITDGEAPTPADATRFREVVESSNGLVFVHCEAGVGRTGSIVSAYLVATGQATPAEALRAAMSIGPLTLQQISFVQSLEGPDASNPGFTVTALSRLLDAPRRLLGAIK